MNAPEMLQKAADIMVERGKQYDKPEGERSMGAAVRAFNAITGKTLTEPEGWLLLQVLKDVRQWQNPGRYHADSAEDCIAYAALKAESLAASSAPEFPDESRIDAIGQNGNEGEHYEPAPSWAGAPEWAEWLAQDEDGEWYWFELEPSDGSELEPPDRSQGWVEVSANGRVKGASRYGEHPKSPNWRNTLQRRPDHARSTD